jgi:DNA invertase Pin-like site-specific DNA recombinase
MVVTIGHLQRLASHGVGFHLLATLALLAKLERAKISQRTKAGLERTRAMGRRLGRSKFSDGERQRLHTALDTGSNWHAVSLATKIPYSTP